MTAVYRAFLFMLPILVSAPFTVYFIDGVLKYKFKNRKIAYLSSVLFAVVAAVFTWIISTDGNGNVVGVFTYDTVETAKMLFVLLLMLLNMKCKLWKKIVVCLLTDMLFSVFATIFPSLRDLLFVSLGLGDRNFRITVFLLLEVLILLFEFSVFVLIDHIRKRYDDTPLPIHFLLGLTLLGLLSALFFALLANSFKVIDGGYSDVMDFSNLNTMQMSELAITALLGLVAVIVLFYVRAARKERDTLKEMNHINEDLVSSQTKYYEASVRADTEIRSIRHDMKNHVQVLLLLLGNQEYDKMRDYLKDMSEDLQSTDISAHTGDLIADAIISAKKKEAEERGLVLSSSGVISDMTITPQDMCRMLANLLDNAIEAASDEHLRELDPDLRKITLEFRRTDKFFLISVTNPCASMVKIEEDSEEGSASGDFLIGTSKKDRKNHGFGLKNIRSAAENYDGELSVSCEEKPYGYEFRAEVLFPISS
ncbi:MAG: GHKL domain-containing protein [Clostridiales bacterium]|nr:GHKL domain-containing protein [Clostridiales bacterium]